jgi:hypothetical protein
MAEENKPISKPPPDDLRFADLKISAQMNVLEGVEKEPTKAQFIVEINLPSKELQDWVMENADMFANLFLALLHQTVNELRIDENPYESGVY